MYADLTLIRTLRIRVYAQKEDLPELGLPSTSNITNSEAECWTEHWTSTTRLKWSRTRGAHRIENLRQSRQSFGQCFPAGTPNL